MRMSPAKRMMKTRKMHSCAIFDMLGRVLKQGRVDPAKFNITMSIAGNYLVKVGNRTQRVSIK